MSLRLWLTRLCWAAGVAAIAVGLFIAYLCQSRTQLVNADGASIALQAWDMQHGNLLLRGWTVADVSFYTTELPQYMIVEAIRGLGSDVVHVSAAMTYTLLVLLAAWLAKGEAKGLEGMVRALLAAGIILAPQLGHATYTLMLGPDHVGTGVPLLVTWLIVDRGQHARPLLQWLAAVAVCVLLAWAAVADLIVEVIGAAPLVAVCGMRAYQGLVHYREPLRSRVYELSLAAAAVISVPAASQATKLIASHGGWTATPVRTSIASTSMLSGNASLTYHGVLELFGADFSGLHPGREVLFADVHVLGVLLVLAGFLLALRRFFTAELLVQLLAVAIVVNLAAYVFGVQAHDILGTREIAAVLPFGAVLAGRLLGGPLTKPRRTAVTAIVASLGGAVLAGYCAMLGFNASQPAVQAQNADLTTWLAGHGLNRGLGGYWQANSITLDSGNTIQVRAVAVNSGLLTTQAYWEGRPSWYDPATAYANFLVTVNSPASEADLGMQWRLTAKAGRPAHIYQYGRYTITVWNKNVLGYLQQPPHL
jgi:hypothetical protein